MSRLFTLALCAALLIACKKSDAPAPKADQTKTADPAKPADPGVKPADPAKPGDPAAPDPAKPGHPSPAAATGANADLENRGVALMRKMGDVFAGAGKDCEKLATDLRAFVAENKALMTELSTLEKKQTEAEKAAYEVRTRAVQDEMQAKAEPVANACADNANVQAAMREFPTD
jgi:hypothetical protein